MSLVHLCQEKKLNPLITLAKHLEKQGKFLQSNSAFGRDFIIAINYNVKPDKLKFINNWPITGCLKARRILLVLAHFHTALKITYSAVKQINNNTEIASPEMIENISKFM